MPLLPPSWAQATNRALRRVPAWPLYLLGLGWALWLFWQAATGALGPEPINTLERRYGELALQVLVAGLAVTPLRVWTGISLIRFRRARGLTAFGFVMAHVAVWAVLDLQSLSRIGEELVKRPYITIGFAGLLALVPLAVTSNNASVRRLGALRWRKLHWLTYVAVPLGAVHYVWLVKGWPAEPFVYLGAVLGLLALRLVPQRRGQGARRVPA